jgi:hypothetical protein
MSTDYWAFSNENLFAVNTETNCCESMLITCFTFCLEVWDVIWEMRFRFVFCKNSETIHSRDHAWSSHRQFFSDRLISFLTNDACSFSIIEWRMSVLDLSSDVYDETSHQTWRKRFIKLDEWKRHLIEWRKRLIKLDEWKRHLIKSDESDSSNLMSDISSNFEKERQSFYFLISDLMHRYIVWET